VVSPCRDKSRVLTPEWAPPIFGVTSHSQTALQVPSTPQGLHSTSSRDYGLPSHLEPYSPSVVITEQGGGTLGSTSGQEGSTSGRHQAAAQLDDRGRSPPSGLRPPHITGSLYPTPGSTSYSRGREKCQIFLPHYKPELLHMFNCADIENILCIGKKISKHIACEIILFVLCVKIKLILSLHP